MDNQVAHLKKKIKELENQLCQRTRNYLYHFKKSPSKQNNKKIDQFTQTQLARNSRQIINKAYMYPGDSNRFQNIQLDFSDKFSNYGKNYQKTQIQVQAGTQNQVNYLELQNSGFDLQVKEEGINHQSQIDGLASQIRYMKEQLQNSKTPNNKKGMKIQFLNPARFRTPQRSQISNMSPSNLFSKEAQTISEDTEVKSRAQKSQIVIESQHLTKQLKILKKQVKKLRAHLQYEIKASNQTKQALLISEQENYKFRLEIQNLRKQIKILSGVFQPSGQKSHSQINFIEGDESALLKEAESELSESTKQQFQKFKSQNQKYQEHISILQGVKRDYLKKLISAKEQIYRLKEQNESAKLQIKNLKCIMGSKDDPHGMSNILESQPLSNDQNQPSPSQNQLEQKWAQLFKQKVHQISNCLPLTNNQELFLFRPDTLQDLICVLDRILSFCKSIQQWQKQKIQAIQKERSNLLRIVSSVLMKHPMTKHTVAEQLSEIKELKYLVNFLNRENKLILQTKDIASEENILQNVLTHDLEGEAVSTN